MAAEDAAQTPEWRPQSSLSSVTDASSNLPSTRLLIHTKSALSPASIDRAVGANNDVDRSQAQQAVVPWESNAGEKLREAIQRLSALHSEDATSPPTTTTFAGLEDALRHAAIILRHNAKWLAEPALITLLQSAIDASATTSASLEFLAAVNLIDTVTIYSLMPPACINDVMRFLSQVYYSATRAHKTNKLASTTWTVLKHILESHLGGQAVAALLHIFDSADEVHLESKSGYAQAVGTLMIVSEKLILSDNAGLTTPIVDLLLLLDSLWFSVVNGTDSVRVAIMETTQSLLRSNLVIANLDSQCSWDVLLDTLEPCITLTPDDPAAKALVETLVSRARHFEPRNLPAVANLAIDLDLPLPPQLSDSMIPIWEEVLPTRDTPNAFSRLLAKLCRSARYTAELSRLIDRSTVDILLGIAKHDSFSAFVQTTQSLAIDGRTTQDAADVLVQALVMLFRHSVRFPRIRQGMQTLFQALCRTSIRCIAAAEALFAIRADVEGFVYVESGLLSQTFPAHSDASSMSAVMHDASSLSLHDWQDVIVDVLHGRADWKTYDYFLAELPSLLGNHTLFEHRLAFIQKVRVKVTECLESGVHPDPLPETGLTKSHVTVALLRVHTAVLSYHRHLSKQEILGIVSTFLNIAGSRDHVVSTSCLHALTICCYELPDLMANYMDEVIDKMSKLVTQRYLAIHVLLFLVGLSRQTRLFHNFQTHDFKKVFGVCGSYLQSIRGANTLAERQPTLSSDQTSKGSGDSSDTLPRYVYALAHHTIAFWYLALTSRDRSLKEYITSCLRYTAVNGTEAVEDQGLVTIDLMDQVDAAQSGLANNEAIEDFEDLDGRTKMMHRLSGLLLLTTETALRTGKTILTSRRATGTEHTVIKASSCGPLGEPTSVKVTVEGSEDHYISIFPDDSRGQTYGRIMIPSSVSLLGSETSLTLPDDDIVRRAIRLFDRTSALDSHKAGVIYIGEGQTTETEILQNCMGSPDYVEFVASLGSLLRLKGAQFNTQGLDRMDDADGEHAVVWHNNLTELVFHIPTLMPNNDDILLNTANKKRHIGNDYVNIVFNNSGAPFDFDTFPSQFNFVYIVITPSARTRFIQTRTRKTAIDSRDRFYAVQVLTRPEYPSVSSAAEEKFISGASMPDYVRNLALNECILSLMWAHRDEPGEYPSSWQSRLQQIRHLRERYGSQGFGNRG